MADPIPVKIRTARKQHDCSEGCGVPIEPGDKYELLVTPPHRNEYRPSDHWLTWRTHWPRTGPNGEHLLGCDLAGAYAENAERHAWAAFHAAGLEMECPSCNTDQPAGFRNGCEDPWHVEALTAMSLQEASSGG